MRAVALGAALAAAACGGRSSKKEPACDPAAIGVARKQLADAPGKQPAGPGWLPYTVGGDGEGATGGAVQVTFTDEDVVRVEVGGLSLVAGEVGSTNALLGKLEEKLAAAPVQVVELYTFRDLSPVVLAAVLAQLDPAVDVHLMVNRLKPPLAGEAAPWAREMLDGILNVRGDQRPGVLADAMKRALGPTCEPVVDAAFNEAGRRQRLPDLEGLRTLLPDALEKCACKGADVGTAVWIYQLLLYPRYETGWLRLKLDTGGLRLGDMRTAQEVAGALETMTLVERKQGVWLVP